MAMRKKKNLKSQMKTFQWQFSIVKLSSLESNIIE